MLVQGWRTGLYPYPFIDAARIGYERAFINGTVLLVLYWLVALLLIGLGRILHRPRNVGETGRKAQGTHRESFKE